MSKLLLALCCCLTASAQQGLRGILKAPPAGGGGAGPTCTNIQFTTFSVSETFGSGSSFSTAATYAPTTDALVLATVLNVKSGTPDTPTFSGNGLTWVRRATVTYNTLASPQRRLTVFQAMGNPTSGAGTADFGGVSQSGCAIGVFQFLKVPTGLSGSNAIANVTTVASNSATVVVVDTTNTNMVNAGFVAFGNAHQLGSGPGSRCVPPVPSASGWTRYDSLCSLTPLFGACSSVKMSGLSSSTTFSVDTSPYAAIFLEIVSLCP